MAINLNDEESSTSSSRRPRCPRRTSSSTDSTNNNHHNKSLLQLELLSLKQPQRTSSSNSRNKVVSFEDHSRIYETLHINDYSEFEKHNCWISSCQISKSRSDIKKKAMSIRRKRRSQTTCKTQTTKQKLASSSSSSQLMVDIQLTIRCCGGGSSSADNNNINVDELQHQLEMNQFNKKRSLLAVFEEQEFQWMMMPKKTNNDNDCCIANDHRDSDTDEGDGIRCYLAEDRIAMVYQKYTTQNMKHARQIGLMNQMEAQNISTTNTLLSTATSTSSSNTHQRTMKLIRWKPNSTGDISSPSQPSLPQQQRQQKKKLFFPPPLSSFRKLTTTTTTIGNSSNVVSSNANINNNNNDGGGIGGISSLRLKLSRARSV